MVKDVRRCSAGQARHIPQKSKYLYGLWLHCSRKRQVSLLQIKKNITILHRKIVNIEPLYGVNCSVWRRNIRYLSILFLGCLSGVMVNDVRRSSASRARRIRGFNPHRGRNINVGYVSTVVEKDKCRCYNLREISILHRKIVNRTPIRSVL